MLGYEIKVEGLGLKGDISPSRFALHAWCYILIV